MDIIMTGLLCHQIHITLNMFSVTFNIWKCVYKQINSSCCVPTSLWRKKNTNKNYGCSQTTQTRGNSGCFYHCVLILLYWWEHKTETESENIFAGDRLPDELSSCFFVTSEVSTFAWRLQAACDFTADTQERHPDTRTDQLIFLLALYGSFCCKSFQSLIISAG